MFSGGETLVSGLILYSFAGDVGIFWRSNKYPASNLRRGSELDVVGGKYWTSARKQVDAAVVGVNNYSFSLDTALASQRITDADVLAQDLVMARP